jgi:aminoglycoside phosphotransferase family enzyme
MKQHRPLFNQRVINCRIRDCHGDIHTSNIFVSDRIYIFDAIEFNERFRYSDVAADLAFLAMDLDFKGRSDLSNLLVERYKLYAGDWDFSELLPFYKCYRAYVRGKVTSFMLDDANINSNERLEIVQTAKQYFKLALNYIESK